MENKMQKLINETIENIISSYKKEHPRIKAEYSRENELERSYKGREILELIQNAEDELTDELPKEVYISFDGDILSIANYGEPFSEDGVISLMYSNNSNKKNRKKKVIGNKGTGFRSILGWADEIIINSGELHVKFSERHAQQELKEKVFNGGSVPKDLKTATLVFPEWIDEFEEGEYTTCISIKIKNDENVAEDILDQLTSLNGNLLLFLNRTQKLTVDVKGKTTCFTKQIINDDSIKLTKTVDGEEAYSKEWLLNKKEGEIGEGNQSTVS